jgi:hypothetical protein
LIPYPKATKGDAAGIGALGLGGSNWWWWVLIAAAVVIALIVLIVICRRRKSSSMATEPVGETIGCNTAAATVMQEDEEMNYVSVENPMFVQDQDSGWQSEIYCEDDDGLGGWAGAAPALDGDVPAPVRSGRPELGVGGASVRPEGEIWGTMFVPPADGDQQGEIHFGGGREEVPPPAAPRPDRGEIWGTVSLTKLEAADLPAYAPYQSHGYVESGLYAGGQQYDPYAQQYDDGYGGDPYA